jgi:acyl carrier protein
MSKLTEQQKEQVKEIFVNKLGYEPEEIKETANLVDDLRMDSLDKVEVIIELEREFDIQIPDEEIENIDTVSGIYTLLEKLI